MTCLVLYIADAGVADTPFDHDRIAAERQAKVVEGIELQRKGRFDLGAAARNLRNGHGLKHHDFATEFAQDFHPIRVTSASQVGFSSARTIAQLWAFHA